MFFYAAYTTTLTQPTSRRRQSTTQQQTCNNTTQPATDNNYTATTTKNNNHTTTHTTPHHTNTHSTAHTHTHHSFLTVARVPLFLLSGSLHVFHRFFVCTLSRKVYLSVSLCLSLSLCPSLYVDHKRSVVLCVLFIFVFTFTFFCVDLCFGFPQFLVTVFFFSLVDVYSVCLVLSFSLFFCPSPRRVDKCICICDYVFVGTGPLHSKWLAVCKCILGRFS